MKTIADFKRKMTVGSKWLFYADWAPNYPLRTCTVSQSNSFALTHPTKPEASSWCDWPKVKEVLFLVDFKGSGITAIKISNGNSFLVYVPVDGVDELQIQKVKGL